MNISGCFRLYSHPLFSGLLCVSRLHSTAVFESIGTQSEGGSAAKVSRAGAIGWLSRPAGAQRSEGAADPVVPLRYTTG